MIYIADIVSVSIGYISDRWAVCRTTELVAENTAISPQIAVAVAINVVTAESAVRTIS